MSLKLSLTAGPKSSIYVSSNGFTKYAAACLLLFISIAANGVLAQGQRPASGPPAGRLGAPGQPIVAGRARITGKVLDSATKEAIEYATVTVLKDSSKTPINGGIANEKGEFKIENLAPGKYTIHIDFIGYKTTAVPITLDARTTNFPLGIVSLINAAVALNTVEIEARQEVIEQKIDKTVYNVEKDVTSQGLAASDVLRKVPQVTVDPDGNVDIQGNGNIRFLINGKPSSMFGNSIADALKAIPASQIKSIEVITSPGAKYDAEGTGGIINIVLRDNKLQGTSGNVNVSVGTRQENASVNLNVKRGGLGFNAYVAANSILTSTTLNDLSRTSFNYVADSTTILTQFGNTGFRRSNLNGGVGMEWEIDKHNSLNVGASISGFSTTLLGFANQQQLATGIAVPTLIRSDILLTRYLDNFTHTRSIDLNLSYRHTFAKEGQELKFLLVSTNANNFIYAAQNQVYAGQSLAFTGSKSYNPGSDQELNAQLDYSHPFSETLKLDVGVKYVAKHVTSVGEFDTLNITSQNYLRDTSYAFNFLRYIYAGYAEVTLRAFQYVDVIVGARFERTDNRATLTGTGDIIIPSYNTFVPNLTLAHTFASKQSIKLAYNRRIQRPSFGNLNPFVNATDPKNLTTGNPNLEAEIADRIELTFNQPFKQGALITLTGFYRYQTLDIFNYSNYYPSYVVGNIEYTNVTVSTSQNVGTEHNVGGSLFGSLPIGSRFTARTNIQFFHRTIQNTIDPGLNVTGLNYNVNLNISYEFAKNYLLEVFGNFNSPRTSIQGRSPAFTFYNIALRKQFWNRNASIALVANNPFSYYLVLPSNTNGPNFYSSSSRSLPLQSFSLNFTYKFGKLKVRPEQRPRNDEQGIPGVE